MRQKAEPIRRSNRTQRREPGGLHDERRVDIQELARAEVSALGPKALEWSETQVLDRIPARLLEESKEIGAERLHLPALRGETPDLVLAKEELIPERILGKWQVGGSGRSKLRMQRLWSVASVTKGMPVRGSAGATDMEPPGECNQTVDVLQELAVLDWEGGKDIRIIDRRALIRDVLEFHRCSLVCLTPVFSCKTHNNSERSELQ